MNAILVDVYSSAVRYCTFSSFSMTQCSDVI